MIRSQHSTPSAALAAMDYVLGHPEQAPLKFLQLWSEGQFEALRRDWHNVPDSVFIGADPTFKPEAGNGQA